MTVLSGRRAGATSCPTLILDGPGTGLASLSLPLIPWGDYRGIPKGDIRKALIRFGHKRMLLFQRIATKLKPCPFCGETQVTFSYWAVRCSACGATGPFSASEETATLKWNTRITPPQPEEEQTADAEGKGSQLEDESR